MIYMVMSMTGYGSDEFHIDDTTITVEMKSVNSRYLDFIPKIPRTLQELEIEMKNIVQQYFHRGRIELYITITGDYLTNKSLIVDWDLMDQYMKKFVEAKERYNLTGDFPLASIMLNDELFVIQETKTDSESFKTLLLESVEKATKQVLANRESEGNFLAEDITNRIDHMEIIVQSLQSRKEIVYKEYRERIKKRIEQHIGQSIEIDEVQLLHEIALLAEKGDITEEITRLNSHIHHFRQVLVNEKPVGRKLDFITQEMLREVNTIGAKSIDSKISEWIIILKSEIEKIKEQVQNIE